MSGIWARAALAAGCAVLAAAAQAQPASVKDAWVRPPAPGQKVAGVYMEIVSLRAEVRDADAKAHHH